MGKECDEKMIDLSQLSSSNEVVLHHISRYFENLESMDNDDCYNCMSMLADLMGALALHMKQYEATKLKKPFAILADVKIV